MSVREVGGYFELERFPGVHYHEHAVRLNSGRGALMYVAELRGIRRIWIPDYMCDSVMNAFGRVGVEMLTYRIGPDFLPVYDFNPADDEWLLLPDYFGQLTQRGVDDALGRFPGRVIVDETQGFFVAAWVRCDIAYTCRKWFGVSDGAYVVTSDGTRLTRQLPVDESHDRMDFVLGRAERPAEEFFSAAQDNNELFESESIKAMSPITENLLRPIDYEAIRKARIENWRVLDGCLSGLNKLTLREPYGPFMYPLLVDDGSSLKKQLIQKKIFVPTLWPNVISDCEERGVAWRYASNIVPLPLDQRYGAGDMKRIVDVVRGVFA